MSSKSSLSDQLRTIAAFLGGSGVALGAYGAHGLVPRNSTMDQAAITMLKENWKTAVMYQLIHAASILTISVMVENKEQRSSQTVPQQPTSLHQAGQIMAVGTALFSGSIYLLCLNVGPKYVWGPTTPIGGMLMIAGWVMMLSSSNNRADSEKVDKQ